MGSGTARKSQQWDSDSFNRVSREAASKLKQWYKAASKPAPAEKPLGTRAMVEKLMPVIRQGLARKIPLKDIAGQLRAAGIDVTPNYLSTLVREKQPAKPRDNGQPAAPLQIAGSDVPPATPGD